MKDSVPIFIDSSTEQAKCSLFMDSFETASETLDRHIGSNPYPGRGLVVGKSASGEAWQQVYFIMGRSPNSRNRQFAIEGSNLETQPFDPSKVEDSSLIIYEAMLETGKRFLVSNGDQTRTLRDGLETGGTMRSALGQREREPDAPNYTPRITGLLDLHGAEASIGLSILKANKINPCLTDRHYFYPDVPGDGIGYGLTTYMGDGTPLPTFVGDPIFFPLKETAEETLETYWDALDKNNRISLAVKEVALDGSSSRIVFKNKY